MDVNRPCRLTKLTAIDIDVYMVPGVDWIRVRDMPNGLVDFRRDGRNHASTMMPYPTLVLRVLA